MDEKDIRQVRSNLTKNLVNVQKRLFKRDYSLPDYENDYQHIKELKEVLGQIEQLTRLNNNTQNALLGKEFQTTDAVGRVDSIKIPLYLFLDTLKLIIEEGLDSTANLSSEKQEISTNIALLRIRLTTLKYSTIFRPNKSFSEDAKKAIVSSNGNFYFKVKEVLNEKFVSIASVDSNQKSSNYHKEVFAFEEDNEYIQEKMKIKEEEYLIQLKKEIAGYFINNVLPQKNQNVELCLIDSNLNESLKKCIIQSAVAITNRQFSYKSYEDLLNELHMYESYINENQSIEEKPNQLFARFRGTIKTEKEKKFITKQDLDEFESAREEQLKQDEEVRNKLFVQE